MNNNNRKTTKKERKENKPFDLIIPTLTHTYRFVYMYERS